MMTFLLAIAVAGQPPANSPKVVIMAGGPSTSVNCPVANAHLTSGMIDGTTAKGFHRLDREPAPHAYLTVARKIEGCDVPVIVPSVLTDRR